MMRNRKMINFTVFISFIYAILAQDIEKDCKHNGLIYTPGEVIYKQCNRCICRGSGILQCTRKGCLPGYCYHNGKPYKHEESMYDGCNWCRCSVNNREQYGVFGCTLRGCISNCQQEKMKASSSDVRMVGNFVPKCRVSDGLYADKQCHGSTGECWCVNPNTGKEIPNTRKGPGHGQVKCRSCEKNGKYYIPGEVWYEECNSCTCGENGKFGLCTLIGCPPGVCYHKGKVYEDKQYFYDQCNSCTCNAKNQNEVGKFGCTEIGCQTGVCYHEGKAYKNKEYYYDQCNSCICNVEKRNQVGEFACTEMGCEKGRCYHKGKRYLQGETRKEDCNTCTCTIPGENEYGVFACTLKLCPSVQPAATPKPPSEGCKANGKRYEVGESLYVDCNNCRCGSRGLVCTFMACPPGVCYHEGQEYQDGEKVYKDCNVCRCIAGEKNKIGILACTRKSCPAGVCYHDGDVFKNGQTFFDGCNTCRCSVSDENKVGVFACTRKACPPILTPTTPPSPHCAVDGKKYKYGQQYHPGDDYCTTCTCGPETHPCFVVDCKQPSCPNFINMKRSCCDYICPGEGCYVGGKKYEIGEEYKTPSDPCTTCVCGSSAENQTCYSEICDTPSCPNLILKEGICCGYECPDENKCDKICTKEHKPLCASNGETYSNLCGFEIAQCKDRQLKKMYDGECRSDGPCHVARLKYEKRVAASRGLLVGAVEPECEDNGDYKLKQCHGSTGYCWCVETKTGEEIPGTKKRGSVDCSEYEGCRVEGVKYKIGEEYHPDGSICSICECGGSCKAGYWCPADDEKVKGSCYQFWEDYKKKVQENGYRVMSDYLPVCNDVDGTFSVEQCSLSSSLSCWCVDTKTGKKIAGTEGENPDCSKYYSKCHAIYKTYQQLAAANDSRLVGRFPPDCNEDGSFRAKQCNPSAASCFCVNTTTGEMIPGTTKKIFIANIDCSEYEVDKCKKRFCTQEYAPICGSNGRTYSNPCSFKLAQCEDDKLTKSYEGECEKPKGTCHVELKEYEKRLSSNGGSILGAYKPDCRDDGYYNVKQCRPSSASCWCVNTRTGQKIPGTEKKTFITNIDCSQYNDVCNIDGKQYDLGEKYHPGSDFCTTCYCEYPAPICWAVMCQPQNCENAVLQPGTCCNYSCPEADNLKPAPPDTPALPQLGYKSFEGKCHKEFAAYQQRLAAYNGTLVGGSPPDCKEDGSFKPKQCNPSTGFCSCVNIATGSKVAGTEQRTSPDNIDCSKYDGCLVSGKIYKIGEQYHPGRRYCTACTCGYSDIGCVAVACDRPRCRDFIPKKGSCCDYICPDYSGPPGPRRTLPLRPLKYPGKCHKELALYRQRLAGSEGIRLGAHEPYCKDDGDYKAKQCNPSAASCWCVNTLTGEKIPDTEEKTFVKNIDCSEYETCNVKGKQYKIGERYHPGNRYCTTCICSKPQLPCKVVMCERPKCPNFVHKEGTCCDYTCPDDSTPEAGGITGQDPACGDLPIVKCTYSPCAQLLCNDNVNATCRENFCGGCNAEFYLGEEKIECKNPVCSKACPLIYEPHCGSDGRTYANLCLFEAAQCIDHSLLLRHKGICKPPYEKPCTRILRPVCGSDGRTYSNECELNNAKCKQKELFKKNDGSCTNQRKPKRKTPRCPKKRCWYRISRVCGSNGKTYMNMCELRKVMCKSVGEITITHRGKCEPCSNGLQKSVCSDNYPCKTAVCPNNPKARCRVNRCGGCQAEFYYKGKKIDDCGNTCVNNCGDNDKMPLCGSDGRTYKNYCEYRYYRCLVNGDLYLTHLGACEMQ